MNNTSAHALRLAACLAGLALLAGCGKTEPPAFRMNMVEVAKAQLPESQQQDIANILEAMFGTPDNPQVLDDAGLDKQLLQVAAGPVRSDQFGKESGLYRRHCAHCHGTTGDGRGPTALLLNPYPRDYRPGKFKFKATERAAKPTQIDLETVVRHGVPGTAMPAFDLLPDAQIKALVEYVKYLSLRGQTETALINAMVELSEGEKLEPSRSLLVDEILKPAAESWSTASENIINPQPKPEIDEQELVAQGQKLFYSDQANCAKCHGWGALGDGQTNDYDDWSKPIHQFMESVQDEETSLSEDTSLTAEQRSARRAQLAFDSLVLKTDALPPRHAIPRNLRQNIYRGGRRPVDLYRRFYAGINGVPMPGVGPATPGATGTLDSDQIWSLVYYVLSLPYESTSEAPRQQHPIEGQARF